MRTKTINLYKFDELSDKAKEKARGWYRSLDDASWADSIYEAAETAAKIIGITINQRPYKTVGGETRYEPCIFWSGFASQGDGACFEGSYSYAKRSVKKIRKEFGTDEVLHAIADDLYEVQRSRRFSLTASVSHTGRYCHSGCTSIIVSGNSSLCYGDHDGVNKEDAEEVQRNLRRFMDWIYHGLSEENDYQMSNECVDDNIRANEYEFTESGKRFA